MSIQTILLEIVAFRNGVASRSPSHSEYLDQIQCFNKQAFAQKLKRDTHAILELVSAVTQDISVNELTLAYQVDNVLHCTSKFADTIPNCTSTERLHRRGYSSKEWDSFPKFHVWVKTGKVLAPVL